MPSFNSNRRRTRRSWRLMLPFAAFALALIAGSGAAIAAKSSVPTFATPDEAFGKFAAAVKANDSAAMIKVLGPDAKGLVGSGDPVADKTAREKFMAQYDAAHKIASKGDNQAILVIGSDEWPFPIPVVKTGTTWHFDVKAGKEEILNRRIGGNELDAIQVCLAYVDAQREYATKDRDNDGFIEYAQKFLSSPGKQDGLYWPAENGAEESPLGPGIVEAQAQGYTFKQGERTPYHGYYYKILKAQGPHAPGGAQDYVIKGHMMAGFALVAFPATYGNSGIMTFIVNYDGVVYQKDLGPNTAAIAEKMTRYDPGKGWTKAQ
ncbi:MAG TPA: DUF2950 domain-containing protein [Stellaceae bacterium]|nr:DUF2950 domain-containing protein [Stellaceae bacterium]